MRGCVRLNVRVGCVERVWYCVFDGEDLLS